MASNAGSSGGGRPRKPAVGSRTPTSRPRTVAGRSQTPGDEAPDVETPDVETPDVEGPDVEPVETPQPETPDVEPVETPQPAVDLTKAAPPDLEPVETPQPETPDVEPVETPRPSPRSSPEIPTVTRSPHGLTVALASVIVLLLALGWWELRSLGDDDASSNRTISADRPVQVDSLTVSSVVDQARMATETILSASSEDYDAQVDKATAMMTAPFAKEYRTTKEQIEARFVAAQTAVTVDVSAQGVVSASPSEVVALVFLTQSTTMKRTDLKVAQYRVRVTMLRDGDDWLVSKLDTI